MITVLYVDDEPALLEIAQIFLEETGGFKVRTSISATDALALPELLSFDAIISDFQMPGMDGIAFLKAVRQQSTDIPFILFTGRGREEVVIEAINNGADSYLQKGGDPEAQFAELAHRIRQAVRRKQAERSLQDSERRFSDIIDFLPDATFAIDRIGHVIAWNRATEDMTGVPAEEMLGKGDYAYAIPFYGERRPMLIDLIDKTDEKVTEYYTNVYRSGTSLTAETDHTHPRGHQLLVLAKACYLYNQAGEITGAIESIRDVTGQKRLEADLERKHGELQASYEQITAAEEELREQYDELAGSEQQIRESEIRYRSIVENSPLGMHFYELKPDRTLVFTGANPGADRILGIDHTRFAGQPIETAFPGLAGTGIVEQYKAVAENGGIWQTEQVTYDGEEIHGAYAVIAFQIAPRSMVAMFEDITQKKQEEEERAFSNVILSTQQETSLDAILIVDERGRIINYNRQFIALWRVPEDLVAGGVDEPVLQFVTGQLADPGAFLSRVKYLYEHKEEKSSEELLLKDGRVLERFSAPMLGKSGKYYGRVWYFRDITDRKHTGDALRESEERLRLLIRHAPAALAMFDRDMHYLVASQRWIADYHLGDREIIGHSHYEIFPEIKEDLKAVHRRSLAGEVLSATEDRFERKDGSVQWLSWEVRPWYTGSGAIGGIIIFSEDITDRKKAEAALSGSEQRFRSLIQNSSDMIRIIGRDGLIAYSSPSTLRIFGYDAAGLIGKDPLEFVHPDDRARVKEALNEVFGGTGSGIPTEYRIRHQDGHYVDVEAIASNQLDTPGISGIVVTTRPITERKKCEASLRESEIRFSTVFRSSPVALTLVSATDGKFIDVNDAFIRESGYSREDVIGKTAAEAGIFADRDEFSQLAAAMRNQQTVLGLEMTVRRKTGEIRTCRFSAGIIRMDGMPYILSSVEDVTDHKTAREALLRSEEKYRLLTENSIDIIYSMDLEGNITHISHQVSRYGYTPDQLISHNISEVINEEDLPRVREDIRTTLATGRSTRTMFRLKGSEKNPVWLEDNGTVIKKKDGVASGISGVLRDITERRKAEETLRENEEKYRSLVETSPDIIWEIDPQGVFRYISPMIRTIMGYDPETLTGKPITDLMPEQYRHAGQEYLARMMAASGPIPPFEVPGRHRDGHDMAIEIRPARVVDQTGRVTGFRGVARDVTESKRAGDAIRMANRKLHLLSGITRHDISNQLMSLNGFISLVRKKATDPSLENHFSRIREASDQIMSMIAFTREYEKIGVHAPVWKELREVVEEAVKGILPAQIALKNDIPAGTMVFADPLVVKVFFNLLDNSIRHGHRVTEIRVSCYRAGNDLVVVWEDNGVGIPGKEKDRVFEKGFGKHTGLGMFLGREILSLTGITITETGVPGTGARFEMVVPKAAFRTVPE